MRNTFIILLLSLSFMTLFTTCKNPGIDYNTFSISEENIQPEAHKVMISGKYDFLGDVMSMKLNIDLNEQLANAESYSIDLDNQSFSITVDDLNPGTLYHYCYVVEFDSRHKLMTDIGTFTTLSEKPVVRALEANIVVDTIYVECVVEECFGMAITERGICWNHTGNPSLSDNHTPHFVNSTGEYTCKIKNPDLNLPYFICAYAKNEMGLSYSNEVLSIAKPTVETLPIETGAITQTSATCKGRIEDVGSSPVTEHGICWGTTSNPADNGVFSPSVSSDNILVTLSELTPGTTYYYCAYATNNVGTGYGAVLDFTTNTDNNPLVRIEEIVEKTTGSAECKCFIENEGSSPIIERGVCWSTGTNPTITNSHDTDGGNELGSYSVEITDFTQDESYHVRAYAKNSDGNIGYSAEMTFYMKEIFTVTVSAEPTVGGMVSGGGRYISGDQCTVIAEANSGYRFQYWSKDFDIISEPTYPFDVTSNVSLVAHFVDRPQPPIGTIDGLFTIDSVGNKVYFSQGNLQYNKTSQTWSFMDHQYDIVETTNQNIGDNYANQDIISLFGWGTSSYHNPNDPYNVNYYPWCTSTATANETYNTYGYGPSVNMSSLNLTGNSANYDWGVYNQITANGNNTANSWRVLTKEEWKYVLYYRRSTAVNNVINARYAKANVNNVHGVILFPDSYWHPTEVAQPININNVNGNWDGNSYSATEFALMQAAGAVFLPAAGYRGGTSVKEVNDSGHYWSVSYHTKSSAYEQYLNEGTHNRCDGLSVRLVCPVR